MNLGLGARVVSAEQEAQKFSLASGSGPKRESACGVVCEESRKA